MRCALLMGALLLAGCLAASPSPQGVPAASECPRVELLQPDPIRIATASWDAAIAVRVTNCLDAPFAFREVDCRGSSLDATIEGQGLSLHVPGEGPTYDAPWPAAPCDDPPFYANLSPGESREKRFPFNGGYVHCDGAACPLQTSLWAPAGSYRVVVTLQHENGSRSRAEGNLTLLPPEIPEPDPGSDLEFVMNGTYRVGETVHVLVRNRGNDTYGYSTYYAACGAAFYNSTGYPFRIPPGTHCDIANVSPLKPGETAKLFTWSLDECTKDMWGCAQARTLPPGDYHVRLTLGRYADMGSTVEPRTTIGWDFRIVA